MTALAYLRSIEWTPWTSIGFEEGRCIPCGRSSYLGHHPDCILAAAIADAEELEKRRGMRTRAEIVDRNCKACAYCEGLSWVLGENV